MQQYRMPNVAHYLVVVFVLLGLPPSCKSPRSDTVYPPDAGAPVASSSAIVNADIPDPALADASDRTSSDAASPDAGSSVLLEPSLTADDREAIARAVCVSSKLRKDADAWSCACPR